MRKFTCTNCSHKFNGLMSMDEHGWHTTCPKCGNSLLLSLPEGKIIMAFTNPDYDSETPHANFEQEKPEKNICAYYAFNSRAEFLKEWEKISRNPPGMWHWLIEDGHCITSGACSEQDIELICDAWGVVTDDLGDVGSLLELAKGFCTPFAKLYAIDIEWDTDGEDVDLPSEIEIPAKYTDADEISDYISNFTGFCHYGFHLLYKAGDARYPENAVFSVSGDSKTLWIKDYNVRVSTMATVLEVPRRPDKKVLVSLAEIDGDRNVSVYIKKSALKEHNRIA